MQPELWKKIPLLTERLEWRGTAQEKRDQSEGVEKVLEEWDVCEWQPLQAKELASELLTAQAGRSRLVCDLAVSEA